MRLAEVRSMANGVLFSSRKAYQHHEKRLDPNNVNHTCSRSSSLYLSFHQSRTQRHEILFPPAYQSTSYPNLLRDSAQERHMVREGATVRGIPRKHVVLVSISFPTYSLFLSSTKLELYIIALDLRPARPDTPSRVPIFVKPDSCICRKSCRYTSVRKLGCLPAYIAAAGGFQRNLSRLRSRCLRPTVCYDHPTDLFWGVNQGQNGL